MDEEAVRSTLLVSPSTASALAGVKVCMLRESGYALDGRARKQACALAAAGARITMIGVGVEIPADLADSEYDVRLIQPHQPFRHPPLGAEDVWWPVRVAVNLTYTRLRKRQHARRLARRASLVYSYEDELYAAAIAAKPDVIHAFNIRTLSAAIRVRRRTGARVIYDCRDLYHEVDYYDEATKQKFRAAEAEAIKDVDATVTVCETFADVLESTHRIPRPTVVYNGPSRVVDSVAPVGEPVRLLFQGAFFSSRNLVALADAMRALRGRAILTLQGFKGIENELRRHVSMSGLDDVVIFASPVDPMAVVESAALHDVGIVCQRGDNLNLKLMVPNKLMDYLGAGLALAVSDLEGHRSVLDGTGAAAFIDPTSAESIAEGLARIVDNPERIAEMKHAALETARRYEWSVQAEKLIQVYQSVLGAGTRRDD